MVAELAAMGGGFLGRNLIKPMVENHMFSTDKPINKMSDDGHQHRKTICLLQIICRKMNE